MQLLMARARMNHQAPPSGGGDPYWANVISLLHFDGADGSTNIVDECGKVWTKTGAVSLTTSRSAVGGSCLALAASPESRIDCTHADFNFGTGDFTIEGFVSFQQNNRAFFSFAGSDLVYTGDGVIYYYAGDNAFVGNTSFAPFIHIAYVRQAGVPKIWVNGANPVSVGRTSAFNPGTMRLGQFNSGNVAAPYIDEVRVTKGVCRYTGPFTPPTAPFPNHA